jgi:hypothetical protein
MNATELIVELVLAGLLMLVVLLLPAVAAKLIPLTVSAEMFAAAIAAGFVLGVVVDRSADTILERWLGLARCRFAFKARVMKQRAELLGKNATVSDCFPEAWMRIRLLSTAGEGVVRAMEQLRIRVRVARNAFVLTPALTTSACAATWIYGDPAGRAVGVALPALQIVAVTVVVWLAERVKAYSAPYTTDIGGKEPDARQLRTWFWKSPAILWFAIHVVAALFILFQAVGERRRLVAVFIVSGAALTLMAARAWLRVTDTFMTFLWDYWRFGASSELVPRVRSVDGP